jgi:phage-related baseplate assembly protein
MALSKPEFLSRDVQAIITEMVAAYEAETGKVLQPAQVERLIFNAFAYREGLLREAINETGLQNLVEFSRAPVIDYLGDLVGVKRLGAIPARVALTFTINGPAGTKVIPAGTRVATADGRVVFQTLEEKETGVLTGTMVIDCICTQGGVIGNGLTSGTITQLIDPLAFVASVTNAQTSTGGADTETDDQLRERIKLAPASFSNAGSRGAYVFWARTANQGIVDVYVTSNTPGTVNVYPLMANGVLPNSTVINEVSAVLNSEKIRPLTDTVVVAAPTKIDASIELDVTILTGYDGNDVLDQMQAALEAFAAVKRSKLGQDVTESQVFAAAMVEGVYKVEWPSPWTDIEADPNEFVDITDITLNNDGTADG